MFVQKCNNCHKHFKWVQIVKSIWKGYQPVICNNCNTEHYIKRSSRLLVALSFGLSIIPIECIVSNFEVGYYGILIYLILVTVISFIAPIYTRYNMKAK
jgi:CXXC-20-CXXC protein